MELRQDLQDRSKIQELAWNQCDVDDTPIKKLVPGVRERGYLTKPELVKLACWKLPDRWKRGEQEGKLGLVKTNCRDDVKEVTCNALTIRATNDSIRCLLRQYGGLHGVGWAIGSAILHWFHKDPYPIWDRHARWSVQLDKDHGSFKRWKTYVEFCRSTADEYTVCMRTLDRALLQYGKDNNPRSC